MTVWKTIKTKLSEKIDVKVTGYISVMMFALSVVALIILIVMSVRSAGALPLWVAFAGAGIMAFDGLAIGLSKWGQAQTGRRLMVNKTAVWLNRGMILVMLVIYGWGLVLIL